MNLSDFIILFVFIIFVIILYIDLKYFRIPNSAIILLIFLGFIYSISNYSSINYFYYYLLVFFLVIFCGFGLFILEIWGAGDAKLMAASVFFIDLTDIVYFVSGSFVFGLLWGVGFTLSKNTSGTMFDIGKFLKMKIPFAPGIFTSLVIIKIAF